MEKLRKTRDSEIGSGRELSLLKAWAAHIRAVASALIIRQARLVGMLEGGWNSQCACGSGNDDCDTDKKAPSVRSGL